MSDLAAPFDLRTLQLPEVRRILVLAPHPDDFDAVALTLRYFHDRGADIRLAVLTNGASGVEDDYPGAADVAARTALREAEQRASCLAFGLAPEQIDFLRLPFDASGNPRLDLDNLDAVRRVLREHAPQLVFMPHGNDSNVTHQRSYALFRTAVIDEELTLTAFLNRDAKTIGMRDDVCLPFGEADAEWKAGLLRLHDTQQQRNLNTRGHGFDARVLAINRASAAELGLEQPYAEVFELESWPRTDAQA